MAVSLLRRRMPDGARVHNDFRNAGRDFIYRRAIGARVMATAGPARLLMFD